MTLKQLKDRLYFLKGWTKVLITYPTNKLNLEADFDYDEYWRQKRGQALAGLSAWQRRRAKVVANFLKQEKGAISIGDIGSGSGSIIVYLKEFLNITKGTAYDSSKVALEAATENGLETMFLDLRNEEDRLKIVPHDYHLLFEILEHVPASEKLLAAAFANSSKGVFFSFPNTGFLIHRCRLMFFGRFPMQWRSFPNEHVRFWTIKDVRWWLKALGYTNYQFAFYAGVPILRNIWPNMFCSGLMVYLKK